MSEFDLPCGGHMSIYGSSSMSFSIKLYKEGLVTTTVEYYTNDVNEHKIVNDVSCLCCIFG